MNDFHLRSLGKFSPGYSIFHGNNLYNFVGEVIKRKRNYDDSVLKYSEYQFELRFGVVPVLAVEQRV